MPAERRAAALAYVDLAEPDEWDLDVRLGELGTVLCGCAGHDLAEFVPTGGGGTCTTGNPTCPHTCAGATCAATCPDTCRPTCRDTCRATCPDTCRATCRATCHGCGPTQTLTCANTHCFTCRSGCQIP